MEFEDHFNLFSNTLLSELDKAAPLQTRTQSAFSIAPPWMDREFKDMRATRRKLERKWRKSGLEEDKAIYIQKRIECAEMSSTKRSAYFGNLIASKEGDQRSLFQIVSKLLDKTKASGILPQHEDSKDLASKFNQFNWNFYFSSRVLRAYTLLHSVIPAYTCMDPVCAVLHLRYQKLMSKT